MPQENKSSVNIAVAAKHDTSYQNDAGGIKASRPVVLSLPLLNHRLLAEMPPASSRSKSAIHGREEYITYWCSYTLMIQGSSTVDH